MKLIAILTICIITVGCASEDAYRNYVTAKQASISACEYSNANPPTIKIPTNTLADGKVLYAEVPVMVVRNCGTINQIKDSEWVNTVSTGVIMGGLLTGQYLNRNNSTHPSVNTGGGDYIGDGATYTNPTPVFSPEVVEPVTP